MPGRTCGFKSVLNQGEEMAKKKQAPAVLARTIAAAIRAKGTSAYPVGKASGVSPSIISRFLSGERGLTLRTAEKLAKVLGLTLESHAGAGK
jgi:transcriptional regulator with XRE-family HTH domain